MKKLSSTIVILFLTITAFGQSGNFDVYTFSPPLGWKTELQGTLLKYTIVNEQTKEWAMLLLVQHKASKAGIEADLAAEWDELVAKPYHVNDAGVSAVTSIEDGWKTKTSAGNFDFEGKTCRATLHTYSGHNRCASIIYLTTETEPYDEEVELFFASLKLNKETAQPAAGPAPVADVAFTSKYHFATSNFDDGWVSTEKSDWVEVAKDNMRVLVHYPNKKADEYNSSLKAGDLIAWDQLVSTRYHDLSNFQWQSIQSWESISFMQGDAVENATGQRVHVVLFKQHFSAFEGRWLEFITPDIATFDANFDPYHHTEFDWKKTSGMQFRNKFAVAPEDLLGKWTSSDYSSLSYYYSNGGGYAGSTATSLSDQFEFINGTDYTSDHAGASGVVGAQKFSREVYKGKFEVTNWSLTLTNRFKGASETFDCQFEAVRGGRILVLKDTRGGGYNLVRE